MSVCWDLPLRNDAGEAMIVRAVLRMDEHGNANAHETSDRRLDRDEREHLERRFYEGVKYAVTKDRVPSTLIYYREDGTPWLDHHSKIHNISGHPDPIDDRVKRVAATRKKADKEREMRRRKYENERKVTQALKDEAIERDAFRHQDELEANPLWGAF